MRTITKLQTLLLIIALCAAVLMANAHEVHPKCKAITKEKKVCANIAQTGSEYCALHNPANWCEATTQKGTRCHSIKMGTTRYCYRHQQK